MPQVIRSGSTPPSKKSSGSSQGGQDPKKVIPAIAAVVVAVLLLLYAGYTTLFAGKGAKMVAASDKVAPPPGYPDKFPYNVKMWQEGKMMGGGFPLPPSMGGQPPKPSQ